MRVNPTVQSGVAGAGKTRRAGGGGFSLDTAGAAQSAKSAGAALGIHSVDALMALQGVEDATERRKRFAKKGTSALDLLDALKVEILEGQIGLETLRRLEVTLQGLAERSGEAGLDDVLGAITVRVAVEIAKRQPASASAA